MLNTLKTKLGLGSQEQDVASVGMDDNNALLWDEISDHAASEYSGGKNTNLEAIYRDLKRDVIRKINMNSAKTIRRMLTRRRSASVRRLGRGIYSVRYRAVLRPKNREQRGRTTTTVNTNFSPAQNFNL